MPKEMATAGNAIAMSHPMCCSNGIPAARRHTTACGKRHQQPGLPIVLINGRPAVVTGRHSSHGDVVVGGFAEYLMWRVSFWQRRQRSNCTSHPGPAPTSQQSPSIAATGELEI